MGAKLRKEGHARPLVIFAVGFMLSCLCCVLVFCNVSALPNSMMIAAFMFCGLAVMLPVKHSSLILPMISYGVGIAFFMVMQQAAFVPSIKYVGTTQAVEIMVIESAISHETYSTAIGEIRKIGADKTAFRAKIYLEDASPNDIKIGDVFRGSFAISAAPREHSRGYVQDKIFLSARQTGGIERIDSARNSVRFLPEKIAEMARISYDETLPKEQAALMRAVVTGDKSQLSMEQRRTVVTSGTSHITAVSGLHITLLLGLIIAMFGVKIGSWVAVPIIVIYVLIVGAPPSAIRAAIMIMFSILATSFARNFDTLTAVVGAMIALIFINPWSLLDIGLQLSFASVLGLLLFLPPMSAAICTLLNKQNILHKLARFICKSVASTVAVFILNLPLLCLYFPNVSAVSMLGNLLILPIMTIVVAMGIAIPLVFYFAKAIVAPFAILANVALTYVGGAQSAISQIPNATIPSQNIFMGIFAAVVLVLGVLFLNRKKDGIKMVFAAAILGASCMLFAALHNAKIADIAILNGEGGAILMARQGNEAFAFCSGEFVADSYFLVSQRQLDKWSMTKVQSLMALERKSVEVIDQADKTWEKVIDMKAPKGFNNASFIGQNAYEFAGDGEARYSWGGARWHATGETYIAEVEFVGGNFLLACDAKAADLGDIVARKNIKADCLVINASAGQDLAALKDICKNLQATQMIYMEHQFSQSANLAEIFDGEIKYIDEYDSANYKMRAGAKEQK